MKDRRTNPLTAHVGFWLRYVSNHVSHAFAARLAGRGVTVAEWAVMRELFDADAIAPSALAEKMGMTRGAISKLADRLEAKSLALRRTDKSDRRHQTLSLTAKGRALVPALAALADRNDAEFFGHLKRSEREQIVALMQEIVRSRNLKTIPTE